MKKRNFALQRPDQKQEETTYIGTLEEMKERYENAQDNPKETGESTNSNIVKNLSQEIPIQQSIKKGSTQKKSRKLPPISFRQRKPIMPGFVKQKPMQKNKTSDGDKKKRKWLWLVLFIFLWIYVSSPQIVIHTFPQHKTYTDKLYYPLQIVNKYIPFVEKYQNFIWEYYQKTTQRIK